MGCLWVAICPMNRPAIPVVNERPAFTFMEIINGEFRARANFAAGCAGTSSSNMRDARHSSSAAPRLQLSGRQGGQRQHLGSAERGDASAPEHHDLARELAHFGG